MAAASSTPVPVRRLQTLRLEAVAGGVRCSLDECDAEPAAAAADFTAPVFVLCVHPDAACQPGVFGLTPASMTAAATVHALAQAGVWRGRGIDWGCGKGTLALLAAQQPQVEQVVGLDLDPANVAAARANLEALPSNAHVQGKVLFARGDSFQPLPEPDGQPHAAAAVLQAHHGGFDFVVANPPASVGDGFDFRRRIVNEAADVLRPGGLVLAQWLSYYGVERAQRIPAVADGRMIYRGQVAATPWVSLGVHRAREVGAEEGGTLYDQVKDYAAAEPTALRYHCHPLDDGGVAEPPAYSASEVTALLSLEGEADQPRGLVRTLDPAATLSAVETLARMDQAKATGEEWSPLCRWTIHLFQKA